MAIDRSYVPQTSALFSPNVAPVGVIHLVVPAGNWIPAFYAMQRRSVGECARDFSRGALQGFLQVSLIWAGLELVGWLYRCYTITAQLPTQND